MKPQKRKQDKLFTMRQADTQDVRQATKKVLKDYAKALKYLESR